MLRRYAFTLIALVLLPGLALADRPISIKVKNPDRLGPDDVLLAEDWSLVLEFEAVGAIGIVDDGQRPEDTNKAWILRDPDGCINMAGWIAPGNPGSAIEGCAGGVDETWVRFTPDSADLQGVSDSRGILDLLQALQDDAYDPSNLGNLNKQYFKALATSTASGSIGPSTENVLENQEDGYGYGVNDDFPGLYIWAEIGTGVVTDEFLNPILNGVGGKKLRNMAGLVSTISYTQASAGDRSSLVAILNVQRGVLEPVVQVDYEIDPSSGLPINSFERRLDSGPVESFTFDTPGDLQSQTEAYEALFATLEPYQVVLKAVVVEGDAEPFLEDLNGNGVVGAGDLILAGHTLLSDVLRVRVRAIQPEALDTGFFECGNARMIKNADLDGDGQTFFCSTGSARSIVRRPR